MGASSALQCRCWVSSLMVHRSDIHKAVWGKLNDPRMPEYQKAMAPLIIPGSHRWDIFRIQEG